MTNLVTFPGLGLSFEISRVAFTIGGVNIYWYGVVIAVGLVLAMIFAMRHCTEFGIDGDSMVDVLVVGVVLGILSARAYYVAMAPFKYQSIREILSLRDGGLAIYGGIIGAVVFGGLACKWRKVPVLPMFDLTGMGFLIGQCLGRWGNFFNQEAFGCNTTLPWGMYSAATEAYLRGSTVTVPAGVTIDPTMPVHPTFLYESIWCLVGFVALRFHMKKRRFNGDIALLYAIWYGLGRFWIEGLRTDSLLLVPSMGLRASQLVAAIAVVGGIIAEVILRRKCKDQTLMVHLAITADNRKLQAQVAKKEGVAVKDVVLPVEEAYAGLSRAEFADRTKTYNDQLKEMLEARLKGEPQPDAHTDADTGADGQ
ncbi:prolipoprotein diacylglyceryl transferase [Faecalibacterium sp. An122]|uniref:prolipoprotein diacylglyceryl transferase n=1 Tax=Faecalibacterium sp. An122 TaxID=1965551 RepID=UPI000B366C15|nr:prolipoprotein diacylglyceryl transferase [Faecalibacterium sp. An122]OUQ39407.1 prolipoprotein diacylglyceryl transferase [Faecalibacterium sp. An122]